MRLPANWACSAVGRWLLHRSPLLKSTKRFRLNQITKEKMLKKLMYSNEQLALHRPTAGKHRRSVRTQAMAIVFALAVGLVQSAQAQTYKKLHDFTGGIDGKTPFVGLTMDKAGNFYGTTYYGGSANHGVVFKMTRKNGGFVLNTLHSFGNGEGIGPYAKVTIGPDGGLYGTTQTGISGPGCGGLGCGTGFRLSLPPTACIS